jgi:hypothetical protein
LLRPRVGRRSRRRMHLRCLAGRARPVAITRSWSGLVLPLLLALRGWLSSVWARE